VLRIIRKLLERGSFVNKLTAACPPHPGRPLPPMPRKEVLPIRPLRPRQAVGDDLGAGQLNPCLLHLVPGYLAALPAPEPEASRAKIVIPALALK